MSNTPLYAVLGLVCVVAIFGLVRLDGTSSTSCDVAPTGEAAFPTSTLPADAIVVGKDGNLAGQVEKGTTCWVCWYSSSGAKHCMECDECCKGTSTLP